MPKFERSTGYKQSPASMIAGTKAHKAALKDVQPPLYQKVVKEGEAQDENKIFNDKGVHIGNYVNDKPVYFDWVDEQRKPEASKEKKDASPATQVAPNQPPKSPPVPPIKPKDPYTKEDYKFLEEQKEERVHAKDYLTKKPVGPIA